EPAERRAKDAAGGACRRQDAVEERETRAIRDLRDVQLGRDEVRAAADAGDAAERDERDGALRARDERIRDGVDRGTGAHEATRTVPIEQEARSELSEKIGRASWKERARQ